MGEELLVLSYPGAGALPLDALTECEAATLLLALQGITNSQIGYVRAVSTRTVANQLASAYRKLGGASRAFVRNRAKAQAWKGTSGG